MPRLNTKKSICTKCKKLINSINYCINCSRSICEECKNNNCVKLNHHFISETYFECNVCNIKKNNIERATITTCIQCKKKQKRLPTQKLMLNVN